MKVKKGKGNTAVSVGPGSTANNVSGTIDADVEMEGVAVINDDVFIDGEKRMTLRGHSIATDFQDVVEDYIQKRFGTSAEQATL